MQETQVRLLAQEDPLEKEMATHSHILAWWISRTEETGRVQSKGSQKVRHDWDTKSGSDPFSALLANLKQFLKIPLVLSEPSLWIGLMKVRSESVSPSVVSDSLRSHGLSPTRLLCPWDSPGKNTGVGSHFLLQGIFLTQGSNSGLQHCRQILYCLNHQGSPMYLSWRLKDTEWLCPVLFKVPRNQFTLASAWDL